MLDLVRAPHHYDVFSDLIGVDMMDHPLCIIVSELDGERLEGVTLWDVVLDGGLKLLVSESLTA